MNEVEAVKTDSQRTQIEAQLADHDPIYSDVWKFGLNTALRISDLLSITMNDVRELDPARPVLKILEAKTDKVRAILLNSAVMDVINRRLDAYPKHVWLFQSTSPKNSRRSPKPINRRSVARVLEEVGQSIRPRVQLGTHSMRKTRGFAMHSAGHSIEKICKVLNHSSTTVTMRYIGLTQSDIDQSYTEFVL